MNRDMSFVKIVERTAKRDAYRDAADYIERYGLEYGLKIIKEKAQGHNQFLSEFPFEYNYGTQSLGPHFGHKIVSEKREGEACIE